MTGAAELDEVRRRLARVEALVGLGGDGDTGADGSSVFWVLEELRRRLPEPGGVVFAGAVTLPDGQHAEWQLGLATASVLGKDWAAPGVDAALSALGSPVRLRLLQAIATGSSSAAELAALEGVGTSGQVYHHVNQLVAAGWARRTTRGRWAVPPERIVPLLVILTAAGGAV